MVDNINISYVDGKLTIDIEIIKNWFNKKCFPRGNECNTSCKHYCNCVYLHYRFYNNDR